MIGTTSKHICVTCCAVVRIGHRADAWAHQSPPRYAHSAADARRITSVRGSRGKRAIPCRCAQSPAQIGRSPQFLGAEGVFDWILGCWRWIRLFGGWCGVERGGSFVGWMRSGSGMWGGGDGVVMDVDWDGRVGTGGGVNLRRGAGVVLAVPVLTSPTTGLRLLLGEAYANILLRRSALRHLGRRRDRRRASRFSRPPSGRADSLWTHKQPSTEAPDRCKENSQT